MARILLTLQGRSLGTLLVLIAIDILLSLIHLDFTKLVAVGMKRDEETVFNVNVLLYFKTDLFLISHDIFISIKLYLVTPRIMLHLFVFLNTFLWVCSISYFGENVILSTHQ